MIEYRIRPLRPEAHLFEVTMTVAKPTPEGQALTMPAWIPGSYMIRDFARHLVSLEASCHGESLAVAKIDKQTWQLPPLRRQPDPQAVYHQPKYRSKSRKDEQPSMER